MMMISSKSTSLKVWKFAMIAFRVIGTRSRLQCFDQGNSVGGIKVLEHISKNLDFNLF